MTAISWDERSRREGPYPVLSTRWSLAECETVDRLQRAALARALPALTGATMLDVGCGIGRLTPWLARDERRVWGVDRSHAMLARAARSAPGPGYVCADAGELPFPDGTFDIALTTAFLQHVSTDARFAAACAELARVVRPGGAIVCCEGVALDTEHRVSGASTVRRTIEEFAAALGDGARLDHREPLSCLGDDYTVLRWRLT